MLYKLIELNIGKIISDQQNEVLIDYFCQPLRKVYKKTVLKDGCYAGAEELPG